jgi:hypothetical protein
MWQQFSCSCRGSLYGGGLLRSARRLTPPRSATCAPLLPPPKDVQHYIKDEGGRDYSKEG